MDYRRRNQFDDISDSITSSIGYYIYEGGKKVLGGVTGIFSWGYSKATGQATDTARRNSDSDLLRYVGSSPTKSRRSLDDK